MPTLSEQLTETTAKLDALLAAVSGATAATEEKKLSPAEALTEIAEELGKATITKERAEYLKTVLAEIAKGGWESNSNTPAISIKIVNDPMQQKPKTESIGTLQSLATGTPGSSSFTVGGTTAQKAAVIQKMLLEPVELKKSALTDKLGDIKKMFGLSDEDLKNEYDLSWKVGDLIRLLQNAVKLEQLVDGKTDTEKASSKTDEPPAVWPRDMAVAKFDAVKKAYEPEKSPWD